MSDIEFSRLAGAGGDLGIILLNRPAALNALTHAMCQALHQQLIQWQADAGIKGVIIRGAGERAFCAGGDVRAIYSYRHEPDQAKQFFHDEYAMNRAIYHFTKPYIAFCDGITMGGGVGVSFYGSHRIATESYRFAMPETRIGFFPDIGAGYFLSRAPQALGLYLGLTGDHIGPNEAAALGWVDAFVKHSALDQLVDGLKNTAWDLQDPKKTVTTLIKSHSEAFGASHLKAHASLIEHCFDRESMEEIFMALEAEAAASSSFAKNVLDILQARSPTSLVISLDYIRRCQSLNFDEVMALNDEMANYFLSHPDFFEGVRALLIDKDLNPQWQPERVREVRSPLVIAAGSRLGFETVVTSKTKRSPE